MHKSTITSLDALVNALRDELGSWTAVAAELGMTESGFLRGVKKGTLSAENLVGIAHLAGVDCIDVLRLGGKGQLASRLELIYGAKPARPTKRQAEFLEMIERVSRDKSLSAALFATLRAYVSEMDRIERELDARPQRRHAVAR
jgi:hypothetical protein